MTASPGPLPVVLVGGYLGAGKTTLVNHLLRQASGRRVAVLVNDFGDVHIDADLIEGSDAGVLSLAGGCLCCSFGDDLVGTLMALARRAPRPDLCLIELSGVALPAAVARTARLALGIELSATLVVADAALIRRQAEDRHVGDTVRQQLQAADWLLLNKPDLVDGAQWRAAQDWLAEAAPLARLLPGAAADLPVELVLGWRAQDLAAPESRAESAPGLALRAMAAPPQPPSPFASRSLAVPDGTDLHALARLLADPALGVLRAKGLARDARGDGQLLQLAGGRWAVTPAVVQGAGRLVLIGLRGGIEHLPDELARLAGCEDTQV
jgi:G3E family GTPase